MLLTRVYRYYTLPPVKNKIDLMSGKFFNIMKLLQKLDRSPKKFGTDCFLTHTEIHLVEIIGKNPGLSVSDIARLLGITKGAVSQNLKKLEIKKLSFKTADSENISRSIVSLTEKGKTAFDEHKRWHEKMDGGFVDYLEKLQGSEFDTINNFMERVEDFLKRRVETEK